jgi:hypothetical protein
MRVEDPVNRRGGLKLGSASILSQNLYFEMAYRDIVSNMFGFKCL